MPPSDENFNEESDESHQGHKNDHHSDEDDQRLVNDHHLLVIPGQGVAIVITPNPPPDIQDDDDDNDKFFHFQSSFVWVTIRNNEEKDLGRKFGLGRHFSGGISEKRVESMLLCPDDDDDDDD